MKTLNQKKKWSQMRQNPIRTDRKGDTSKGDSIIVNRDADPWRWHLHGHQLEIALPGRYCAQKMYPYVSWYIIKPKILFYKNYLFVHKANSSTSPKYSRYSHDTFSLNSRYILDTFSKHSRYIFDTFSMSLVHFQKQNPCFLYILYGIQYI